ncbi:TetR/AcrR family transcriptional regulator [Serpentinicella alkaliphila]|uniref:TetR family transcriptional regulator n=1 Tax=Serpentinicella alkaliphila TaxID=1734049 RepID=A0A4R2TK98_9FIRM|nr:TetR/AcrR family transcriptional regulator [Serpentinicella alkaliphila]QUH26474.1 TetR/AcrR family transcriptional regulator [Serpentinicella alkaliphila]TCQ03246.1 TetR family transcriptional regulator [Serpentinicella alkaliphila]
MVEKKLTKRQIQAINTQDKIYKTAVELIEIKGFQNITVEEICKKAGVSVGSFYNSFKSKNEILDTIFKLADDYFLNVVANNIKTGSTQEKIIKYFIYYADYNVDRGIDFVKQLYTVKNNLFATKGRSMQTVLEKIIDEGQNKGEITKDMTPEETVRFLFIAVRGIVYDWCLHNGEYDLTEAVHSYVNRLIKTLT